MLRQVYVLKKKEILLDIAYGNAVDPFAFKFVWEYVESDVLSNSAKNGEVLNRFFDKFRLSFVNIKGITFVFVTDLTNHDDIVFELLDEIVFDLEYKLEDKKADDFNEEADCNIFRLIIEKLHRALSPKISIVGYSGVGKTTICNLIQGFDIPMEHIPTINSVVDHVGQGSSIFKLWDFAGQERYEFLWDKFLKGSDAVLIIIDSSDEYCHRNVKFLELVKKNVRYANVAIIANKQDLPNAKSLSEIGEIMKGHNVYSMIANNIDNRDMMISILAGVLDSSVVNLKSFGGMEKKPKPKIVKFNSVPELQEREFLKPEEKGQRFILRTQRSRPEVDSAIPYLFSHIQDNVLNKKYDLFTTQINNSEGNEEKDDYIPFGITKIPGIEEIKNLNEKINENIVEQDQIGGTQSSVDIFVRSIQEKVNDIKTIIPTDVNSKTVINNTTPKIHSIKTSKSHKIPDFANVSENFEINEPWILEFESFIFWVLEKSSKRTKRYQWSITKTWLKNQEDFAKQSDIEDFEAIWKKIISSRYGNYEKTTFKLNKLGKSLFNYLKNDMNVSQTLKAIEMIQNINK